jgi:FkbM family methyltransferase
MKELDNTFDWGESTPVFIDSVSNEVFNELHYERIYQVKEGDVVLDLGASVGPFTWSVSDRASKIYSFEPIPDTCEILERNVGSFDNVEVINKALYHTSGTYRFPFDNNLGEGPCETMSKEEVYKIKNNRLIVNTLSFMDFIKECNIDYIDFIKTDTEGGEYNLFKDENIEFLKNNVRTIVGEFHLLSESQKTEFRYFRDKYLKQFKNYKVYSVSGGIDITWSLFKDEPYDSVNVKNLPPFIDYYELIYVYISNE